ncbi:hypothetical protein FB566_2415 [Stackebrandtia endophytica]|uniref:Lipoprotein n=1 Tax=Stackebrandtia endophytica TaxID=1496996 RepID=A0A543AWC9_9ACTN|nr:hypothetical protein [Stackebrandtia endophytica]TQL76873.1 hypothetical protein FB566_2415 [Stackebrandtia endophytica]
MRMGLLVAVMTAALAFAGGCGDSGRSSAEAWAGSVCEALEPWMNQIDELTGAANRAMTPDSSPTDAKAELLELLSGAAMASQTALDSVIAAGVPDVAEGREVADRFADSLAGTRDAYQAAHDDLSALDPQDPGFYEEVARVMTELVDAYGSVPQVAELNSVELSEAFASVPECQ